MDTAGRVPARRRLPPYVAVTGLSVLWLLLAVTAAGTFERAGSASPRPVPWPALVVLFALAQAFVVHVQLRREARSVFVSEIPTFLALLSLVPSTMIVTRAAGALIGFGLLRRQYRQPRKLLFNVTLAGAEAGVAVTAFSLLPAGSALPLTWLAAVLAATAASTFTAVGVALVIGLLEGLPSARQLVRLAGNAAVQALPVAVVGCAVWAAWADSPWAALPLALVAVLLLLGCRAYAGLRERHLALERLYRFSQVVSHTPGVEEVLRSVLQQAREILHGERARLTFVQHDVGGESVEVVLEGNDVLTRGPAYYLQDAAWALATVIGDGQAIHVSRTTRDPVERAWLESVHLRDSVMAPFMGEAGPIAILAVDDRLGDARGFEPADLQLLVALADQASVALRNGELLDRLRHESLLDPLTSLPNRTTFQRELEGHLTDRPHPGCAVGLVDLDSFKEVNDTLGHQEGDRLLCEIAARMAAVLADGALLARLGGDEFAVLFPACPTARDAQRRGAELLQAFQLPIALAGIEVDVSASLGLALAPVHGTTAGVLLKRAEQAMYEAKHRGQPVQVFDPATDTSSPSKLALVAELRHAVEARAVAVHVQPKVDARTGRLCGTEALARWSTPERGTVPPDEFIPLAERSGLIRPLTELVLDVAAAGCAAWQPRFPGVGVAVNVSVRSLADAGLVRLVDRVLRRHGLPAGLLTLEITESHIMADPAGTLSVLQALRERGVRLSVDDFGTGYSSLSYLRRLPVNEVKIDRSFVCRMVHEPDDAAIVRSIVELARTLGLEVVAEGVEDQPTWEALRALGVHEIQGWVVARAMPCAELADWATGHAAAAQLLASS